MTTRRPLNELGLETGKKARLNKILFRHGLENGAALFLPYDQGLEHGPRDLFANPAASDPSYICRLAVTGGFNGIASQIGLAEKTDIPSDASALSPVNATVDDAMLEKTRQSMEAGATGLIFGRNVWQRSYDETLRFIDRLRGILAKYPTS